MGVPTPQCLKTQPSTLDNPPTTVNVLGVFVCVYVKS